MASASEPPVGSRNTATGYGVRRAPQKLKALLLSHSQWTTTIRPFHVMPKLLISVLLKQNGIVKPCCDCFIYRRGNDDVVTTKVVNHSRHFELSVIAA